MKKVFLLATTGIFLMSCFIGWGNDDIQVFKDKFREIDKDNVYCILDAVQSKYSSYEEFETAETIGSDTFEKWMQKIRRNCLGEPSDPDVAS